ncbi:MAG: Vms1/Ankzf1 family peptidyl-tRNA hydrolase [Chloroflexota bacterium]
MEYQDVSAGPLRRLADQWHDLERSGYTYCLPPTQAPPREATLPEDIATTIKKSETGAILFWGPAESQLVLPPFPVESAATLQGWDIGPLRGTLDRSRTILVLLLRLSGFAIGIFDGERLIRSKTGTRFVKGRHRKGGSSSGRFARRREEQARALMDKTSQHLSEHIEAYPGRIDHFLLGGDRLTLLAFEKHCPYLNRLDPIRQHRILNVERPSLKALNALPRLMYMSRVITLSP